MMDSVRTVESDYIKRINSNKGSGRLHKGHSVAAASASIPSKYQTIVIDNSERKGFASRSKRFNTYDYDCNENPGPGSYLSKSTLQQGHSPSYSKKGTGGFASKDRRITKHASSCSPGAGAYGLPTFMAEKKDFNQAGNTSIFHKPIAQAIDESKKSTPAPNQYNVTSNQVTKKSNNVCADAAFRSRSKRDTFSVGADSKDRPAPWQYHINEDLVKDSIKVPFSSFKSRTERRMAPEPAEVPGPGAYKPHEVPEPVKKTVFPRKHYLCISAPAMPLPSTPPSPGPGTYEVVDYEGPERHYMSSSVFVSSTSRWSGGPKPREVPGPAHYRPTGIGKQSFIYNAQGRWI